MTCGINTGDCSAIPSTTTIRAMSRFPLTMRRCFAWSTRSSSGGGRWSSPRRRVSARRSCCAEHSQRPEVPGGGVAMIQATSDTGQMLGMLVERLGQPVGRAAGLPPKWQALACAFRVAALQRLQIVLALDDWTVGCEARVLRDLQALAQNGSGQGPGLTVIRVGCPPMDGRPQVRGYLEARDRPDAANPFSGRRLSHRQARGRRVLRADLYPARSTRLHGLSTGVPRGVEQLAALSLMAGAVRGLEVITPDVVDGVAQECCVDESKAKIWL